METLYFLTKGTLKQFSPQQIIDCSNSEGNRGCDSGNVINSLSYIKNSGISLDSTYPFKQTKESCKY